MMLRITNVLIGIFLYVCVSAQDIHFTNYIAQPMLLNPSLSGLNGCDWRVGGNFRTQWFNISSGNTYRTISAFADFALGKPGVYSNFAGLGASFFSDQAGDLNYNTNKVDLSFAYHLMLSKRATHSLSFGIQGGIIHRSLNQGKALFQFDPITGEPVAAGIENFDTKTKILPDVGLGMLYSAAPSEYSNLHFGFAINHLNQPNLSGFNINQEVVDKKYIKFTIHGGGQIPFGKQLSLLPGFLFLMQGTTFEANINMMLKYKFSMLPREKSAVYFGAMYRVLDAFILATRLDIKRFQIHFSYDLNTSKLSKASKLNGGPEIALIYVGCFNRKNQDRYCPVF